MLTLGFGFAICSRAASEKAPLTAAARHYCTLCEIVRCELPDGAGDGSLKVGVEPSLKRRLTVVLVYVCMYVGGVWGSEFG
ncbi:hypothetical protein J3E69DRAFT_329945 [Trichoderma sp. SZMC 28015]